MKKLVFMFVAMAAISFAACDSKPAAEAPAENATEEVAETDSAAAAPDSTAAAADSTAAPAAAADSTAAPADSAK